MISKEEKQILKAYRNLKEYGVKNIALIDMDRYTIEGFNIEAMKNLIKERDMLKTKCDYYKERYLEFNNAFLQGGKELTKK